MEQLYLPRNKPGKHPGIPELRIDRAIAAHYPSSVIWNVANTLLPLEGLLPGSPAVAC